MRIHLDDLAAADALTELVNNLVIRHRPRTIPVLHPNGYLDLLSRGGVPDTPVNRARLAERTAFTVGAQAGAFTAQLRDPEAFEAFTTRFGVISPDRQMQRADDMIDWLWAWHPLCHHGLTRQVTKWHDGLLQPGSFLTAAAGGEIPAWGVFRRPTPAKRGGWCSTRTGADDVSSLHPSTSTPQSSADGGFAAAKWGGFGQASNQFRRVRTENSVHRSLERSRLAGGSNGPVRQEREAEPKDPATAAPDSDPG